MNKMVIALALIATTSASWAAQCPITSSNPYGFANPNGDCPRASGSLFDGPLVSPNAPSLPIPKQTVCGWVGTQWVCRQQ